MSEQKTGFDFEAMRRAIEQLDADALAGLYADDAEGYAVAYRFVRRSWSRNGVWL